MNRFVPRSYVRKQGSEYQLRCPVCGKANLYWNVRKQGGQCFTCRTNHNRHTIADLVEGRLEALPLVDLRELLPARPKNPAPEVEKDLPWQALWYLQDVRRMSPQQIKDSGVTYDPAKDSVVFPLQPKHGDDLPVAYMSRSTDPDRKGSWRIDGASDKQNYWHHCAPVAALAQVKCLVCVEGIFDIYSPGLEHCAVALLGTKLYEPGEFWFWRHRFGRPVAVWMDPDPAGQAGAIAIKKVLDQICSKVIAINYPKEPGDCSADEAREVLREQVHSVL